MLGGAVTHAAPNDPSGNADGFSVACYVDAGEPDNQWAHVVGQFLPREIFTFMGHGESKPFKSAKSFQRASELPGPVVLVSPPAPTNAGNAPPRFVPGVEPLADFLHPASCTYLFGPDHAMLGAALDIEPAHRVFVEYPGDLQMFSWVAAAVVLYDRRVKRG